MQKTYQEIIEFQAVAAGYLEREKEAKQNTKLAYAIRKLNGNAELRIKGRLADISKQREQQQRDLFITHAAVDEKTSTLLVHENGLFKYRPEKQKELDRDLAMLEQTVASFEPFYCPVAELPKTLSEDEKEAFYDFVIERPAPGQPAP